MRPTPFALAASAGLAHQKRMTAAPYTVRYRWLFVLAVIAGVAFYLTFPIHMPRAAFIVLKGAGLVLLAIWAALNARGRDGWMIAGVMALGAIGDVVLEQSQTGGAIAFLAGHLLAAALYLLHRRTKRSVSQNGLATVLFVGVPIIAFMLPSDRSAAPGVAVYATGLGLMAASAWISRFPRYRVGIGAVMFAASDLLIFAKMGPLAQSHIPSHLIWPLYFAGQALIAWGVVNTLARWKADEDLHHRL
jgi:uncharacterized membrane protein YhhN